ncbi:hypothetical protein AAFF_G00200020 [Aldrovandia affinis]|uniref:Uncharacterized protein n=1 Tax=Aldrovandia affinis TaxID=143900 RepID=A0AAD7RIF8_9TELE|nr:hypothetical protein AAFF_G00200020 [Aldrovandia affinis]
MLSHRALAGDGTREQRHLRLFAGAPRPAADPWMFQNETHTHFSADQRERNGGRRSRSQTDFASLSPPKECLRWRDAEFPLPQSPKVSQALQPDPRGVNLPLVCLMQRASMFSGG